MKANEFVTEAGKVDTTGYKLVKKSNEVELWINQADPSEAIAILDDGAWDGYKMDDEPTWEFEKRRGRYGYFTVDSLEELFETDLQEHKMIWSRSGDKLKLKYRCASGPKAGRIVPDPSACAAPKDLAKSAQMKRTRATTKVRQARKAKKTKRLNPASKILARLNTLTKPKKSSSGKVVKMTSKSTKKSQKPKKLK